MLFNVLNKLIILVVIQICFPYAVLADENSTQTSQLIEKINNEGLSRINASKYEEAISTYNRALHLIKRGNLNDELIEATVFSNLAHAYTFSLEPDYKKAIKFLHESIRIRSLKKNSTEKHINELIAFDHWTLGHVYFSDEAKDATLAILNYKKSLDYYTKNSAEYTSLIKIHLDVAKIYSFCGNINKALFHAKTSLQISNLYLGYDSMHAALALHNIAKIYKEASSEEESARYYERALEIYEGLSETDPLSYINIYEDLALLYMWSVYPNNISYDQAAKLLEKALTIRLKLTSQPNESTAWTYLRLGEVKILDFLANGSKSAELLANADLNIGKSFEILQKIYGPSHSRIADNHKEVGWIYKDLYWLATSRDHLNKALEIYLNTHGAIHESVAELYCQLAKLEGFTDYRVKYFEKALKILTKIKGPGHNYLVPIILEDLSACHLRLMEPEKAFDCYQKRHSFLEEELSTEDKKTGRSYDHLALLHNFMQQKEKALLMAKKGNNIRESYTEIAFNFLSNKDRLAYLNLHAPFDVYGTLGEAEDLSRTILKWKGIILDSILRQKPKKLQNQEALLANFQRHLLEDGGILGQDENGYLVFKDEETKNAYEEAILYSWYDAPTAKKTKYDFESEKLIEEKELLFQDNFDKIRNSLKDGQALLEFIKYKHYHPYRKMIRSKAYSEDNQSKLQLISLPGVKFFRSPLDEVLQELERLAWKHDITESEPSKRGIKIKLKDFENKPLPKISITLNRMTIGSIINIISGMINTSYRIEKGEIVFYAERQIITEEFELSQSELLKILGDQFQFLKTISPNFMKDHEEINKTIGNALLSFGINFEDKNLHSFKFDADSRILTLKHEKIFVDKLKCFLAKNKLNTKSYNFTESLFNRMIKHDVKKSDAFYKSIKIPSIKFVKTPLDIAMVEIQRLAKKHDTEEVDPTKRGLRIIVLDTVRNPDPFSVVLEIKQNLPEITLSLDSMTTDKMIQEITQSANWNYDVTKDAVILSKYGLTDIRQFQTQGFKVRTFFASKGIDFDWKKGHRFSYDGFTMMITHDKETIGYIDRTLDPLADYEVRYGVSVVTKIENGTEEPHWIDLGNSSLIDQEIIKIKEAKGGSIYPLQVLHNQIFKKIAPKLPDKTTDLIISPDDSLCFLPFSCLLDENGKFLCESFRIVNVSSGRDLIAENSIKKESPKRFVGFGNPDFNNIEDNQLALMTEKMKNSEVLRSLSFASLPGSQIEIKKIEELVKKESFKARSFTGGNASEKSLRSLNSPYILHLATHGYFLSPKEFPKVSKWFAFPYRPRKSDTTNPMLYSGILLSGARATLESNNQDIYFDSENDGILLAEEASQLDLRGTWLTVLSACDTGSGVARAGEGVLGLRRAFAMAGTQNLLLTLWPVDDGFTKDFMVSFYKEALKTGNAPRAMAKVQKDWLIKLREERSVSQAVKLAGPFVLTFRGNPELN